jgi:hypothetical protein
MQNRSFKLIFVSLILSLSLTSFAFAGNDHCPDAPPPPAQGNRVVQVVPVETSQLLKSFWDFIAYSTRLF